MDNDYKYDILKMYFCEDYWATDEIVIHEPTIGDIIEYGELEFWMLVECFCANTTSRRLELWENGIDWNKLSDFELFIMTVLGIPKEKTELIFGDLDFTKFKPIKNTEDKYVLVYMPNPIIQIDEDIYNRIVGYLRAMFDFHPKVEKAKGKLTKEAIIEEERINLQAALKNDKKESWRKSTLFPLISALLNHPGCKYKRAELKEIGIVEFMDSVKRLQIYENTTALMSGVYSGMLDTSKMDLAKELNWARDIYN